MVDEDRELANVILALHGLPGHHTDTTPSALSDEQISVHLLDPMSPWWRSSLSLELDQALRIRQP